MKSKDFLEIITKNNNDDLNGSGVYMLYFEGNEDSYFYIGSTSQKFIVRLRQHIYRCLRGVNRIRFGEPLDKFGIESIRIKILHYIDDKYESFKMVVFDPPHLNKLGKESWMAKKYGVLTDTWQSDIKKGFDECMRVLEPFGTLIFKWNENQIKVGEVLKLIDYKPIVGHKTGKSGSTHWMVFLKLKQKGGGGE